MIARQNSIAVVGLGVTGLAAVRFLKNSGYSVGAFESNPQSPGITAVQSSFPELAVHVGPLDEDQLAEFDEILLSPGVPRSLPALQRMIERGVPVRSDVDWFVKLVMRPVIAVTGSNGKSTVVSWLTHVLKACGFDAQAGGNIGVPVLDLLSQPEAGVYVLELSSFQLESIESLGAHVACVLNVCPDHMDRYPSLERYAVTKQRIYRQAITAVYNRSDVLTQGLLSRDTQLVSFGCDRPETGHFGVCQTGDGEFICFGSKLLCEVKTLPLPGRHNLLNALAVFALAHAFGVPAEQVAKALKSFSGLPHRCQKVGEIDGVVCYNDSKATNVGAAQAAILGLGPEHRVEGKPGLVLLLGGLNKDSDFSDLRECIQTHVAKVIVFGQAAELLERQLCDVVSLQRVSTLTQAFDIALDCAKAPGAILLSPACASFDQFENYQDRGLFFGKLVARKSMQEEAT